MLIFRLTWTKFASETSGEGSRINGGRWNKIDIPCIYTAESRALAVLEYAVNVTIDTIPKHLSLVTFKIPDDGYKIFTLAELPKNWDHKESSDTTRNFGTPFLEKAEHLILKIPSVVIPEEFNYIINPLHPDMKKVNIANIAEFSFDVRLKK